MSLPLFLARWFRTLASMVAGLVLFGLVAIASMAGSVVPIGSGGV